jgi:hypothetical protein
MEVLEVLSDTPPSGTPSATEYLDIHCSVHTQYELKTFPINPLSLPALRSLPTLMTWWSSHRASITSFIGGAAWGNAGIPGNSTNNDPLSFSSSRKHPARLTNVKHIGMFRTLGDQLLSRQEYILVMDSVPICSGLDTYCFI